MVVIWDSPAIMPVLITKTNEELIINEGLNKVKMIPLDQKEELPTYCLNISMKSLQILVI